MIESSIGTDKSLGTFDQPMKGVSVLGRQVLKLLSLFSGSLIEKYTFESVQYRCLFWYVPYIIELVRINIYINSKKVFIIGINSFHDLYHQTNLIGSHLLHIHLCITVTSRIASVLPMPLTNSNWGRKIRYQIQNCLVRTLGL